jgi:hypothetical protein
LLDDFGEVATFGQASTWLMALAEQRAQELTERILDSAIMKWADANFSRGADDEGSCTIRLYACAREVKEYEPEFTVVSLTFEATSPTPAMLQGLAHPRFAPRPDLKVSVGKLSFLIEAKRLGSTGRLSKKYVTEGMSRFTSGRYVSPIGSPGYMVGYVFSSSIEDTVGRINFYVDTELAVHGKLIEVRRGSRVVVYESGGPAGISINHHLLAM